MKEDIWPYYKYSIIVWPGVNYEATDIMTDFFKYRYSMAISFYINIICVLVLMGGNKSHYIFVFY